MLIFVDVVKYIRGVARICEGGFPELSSALRMREAERIISRMRIQNLPGLPQLVKSKISHAAWVLTCKLQYAMATLNSTALLQYI